MFGSSAKKWGSGGRSSFYCLIHFSRDHVRSGMGWEENVVKFLRDRGVENLTDRFIAEEIQIQQIPKITDEDLKILGVETIGGRMRIREAAAAWSQSEDDSSEDESWEWACVV